MKFNPNVIKQIDYSQYAQALKLFKKLGFKLFEYIFEKKVLII
jgi:hypothetical protein